MKYCGKCGSGRIRKKHHQEKIHCFDCGYTGMHIIGTRKERDKVFA